MSEIGESVEEVEMSDEEVEMSDEAVEVSASSEEFEVSGTSTETSGERLPIIQLKIGNILSPCKVYEHLEEQFGQIELASFIPGFGFILFHCAFNPKELLAGDRIEIEGHIIPVKRADYSNLPYVMYKCIREYFPITPFKVNQLLLQPEDEASPNNILHALNEHCVQDILMRLNLLDLFSVAKTCRQWNGIAKTVFERKYKNKMIKLSDLKRKGETVTMMEIRCFLENFGSSITWFNCFGINEEVTQSDLLGLLDKHCKSILKLTLDDELLGNFPIDNYNEMFGRLKQLHVLTEFQPINRLLTACSQLESLVIVSFNDFHVDLKHVSLPSLVSLDLQLIDICDGIKEFLRCHSSIEHFSLFLLVPINSDRHYDYTNELINECLPNISQIELHCYSSDNDDYRLFSGKKKLSTVRINCGPDPITPILNDFLDKNAPIKRMELFNAKLNDDTIDSICRIKTLEKIKFSYSDDFDDDKFIRIIKTLPNLNEIFTCSMNKPAEFLDKILPILQNKRIKWLHEIHDKHGSYDPKYDVVFVTRP